MHNSKEIIGKPIKALFVTFGGRPQVTKEIDPHQWICDRVYDYLDWSEAREEIPEDAEWPSEHDPDVDALVTEYRLNTRHRFQSSIPALTPW